jgi:hypothetical protein
MADMGAMEMPMPDNTLPMMTGFGQYGPLEMGGMFTVIKVRDGLGANDYGDPGPYTHPEATVAREVSMAEGPSIPRSESPATEAPADLPRKRRNPAPRQPPSRRS